MTGDQTANLREHLLYLLKGGGAHLSFDKAIACLPASFLPAARAVAVDPLTALRGD